MVRRARRRQGPHVVSSGKRSDQEVLVWTDLCEVARRLGFEVREEALPDEARVQGGVVRLLAGRFFLVEARLSRARKNELLADLLRRHEVRDVYMPPYLREWLCHEGDW